MLDQATPWPHVWKDGLMAINYCFASAYFPSTLLHVYLCKRVDGDTGIPVGSVSSFLLELFLEKSSFRTQINRFLHRTMKEGRRMPAIPFRSSTLQTSAQPEATTGRKEPLHGFLLSKSCSLLLHSFCWEQEKLCLEPVRMPLPHVPDGII